MSALNLLMQGLLGLTTVIATIAIMSLGCYISALGAMKFKGEKSLGAKDILISIIVFFLGILICVIGVSAVNVLFVYTFDFCCRVR